MLSTASISILTYAHDCPDEPAIALWNWIPTNHSDAIDLKRRALNRWENEGGKLAGSTDSTAP
jgi:hypothetical protein